jgi:hypothetical protein
MTKLSAMNDDRRLDPLAVARDVNDLARGLFSEVLVVRAAATLALAPTTIRPIEANDLAAVDASCLTCLHAEGSRLGGVGFFADPDLTHDPRLRIRWWVRDSSQNVHRGPHDTDPRHDSFYEYADMEWFSTPREHGAPFISGPYVDYGGTNDYTITLAMCVERNGQFAGVAAGDVPAAHVETLLAGSLRSVHTRCVVLNHEQRIVVSNDAHFPSGHLMRDTSWDWHTTPCEVDSWNVLTTPRSKE